MASARSSPARSKARSSRPITPRSAPARSRWRSGSPRTASSSATASARWPGTPGGISKPGTASSASARSITRSTRGCSPSRSCWIVNHAEDRMMFVDLTFVPLLEKIADKLPTIERYVVLTDAAHMPKTTLKNAVAYEDWIAEVDGDFAMGRVRREHRRRHVLHLRHHRAIRRACSIRTAPTCCTPISRRCRIPRASPRATW